MLASFLIMFREGVEAALIVGIIASYLRQTGRIQLMKAIWLGVASATLMCLGVAILLQATRQDFPQKQQELFASVIAFVAVGVLTWMVFWMKRASRSIKGELQSQVESAIQSGDRGGLALVGMAFLAVAREGLETVVFLLATLQQSVGIQIPIGAFLGYVAAIVVGVGIYQGGIRINLKRFFKWTGAFIILVAAGLLAGGVRALHEAGVWNGLQGVVFDLSNNLPTQGLIGSLLAGFFGYNDAPTVGEVIVYLGYLIPVMLLFLAGSRTSQTPVKQSL
ncbi:MAG: FTR1 family protein [Stenomitos rutilans HA7619-LM2]|jgi:high-affinity iron transporter|nr:FTR1 family protein [Stenomitos rutilans HA7619-LM2]